MTIKLKFLVVIVVSLSAALFAPVTKAQDTPSTSPAVTVEATTAIAENAVVSGDLQPLEGVELKEVKRIPSNFGLWWKNISEWTSLALTLDPVKKAEKRLLFAEQRTKLANYIIEHTTDPKIQEKAKNMLEKADEYMKKIEEKKAELAAKQDERTKKLLENVAKHEANKQTVLEKVEDLLSPEALLAFQTFRKASEEDGKDFLKSLLADPNVSSEIKDAISKILSQVQATQTARQKIREEERPVIEAIKQKLDGAKEEFEKIREQRKQDLEKLREQYKDDKEEIIDKIQEGDKDAVKELKALNAKMKEESSKVKSEVKKDVEDLKDKLEKAREEVKQEMEQKREDAKDQVEQVKQETEDLKCTAATDCPVIVCAQGETCKAYKCDEGECKLEDVEN